MTKTTYERAQAKIAQTKTGINHSKAYRQVTLRQLCKYMKVPADSWRGLAKKELQLMES